MVGIYYKKLYISYSLFIFFPSRWIERKDLIISKVTIYVQMTYMIHFYYLMIYWNSYDSILLYFYNYFCYV